MIFVYQIVPLIGVSIYRGCVGLAGGLAGCVVSYFIWVIAREYHHRETIKNGPRIVTTLNRIVGSSFRQQVALWSTTLAFPVFWAIRAAKLIVYPVLVWGVHLPAYKAEDCVVVSRHKFEGLVGHGRLW